MALNVALIDSSEIIKKMLSHCLHYYDAKVHRFESLDDFKLQISSIEPQIIFVDWDLKKNNLPLAPIVKEEFKDIPVVAIYRNSGDTGIEDFPHRIKKPLDVNLIRKMVDDLLPSDKSSKIHGFLSYPTSNKKASGVPSMNEKTSTPKEDKPSVSFDEPAPLNREDLTGKHDFAPAAINEISEDSSIHEVKGLGASENKSVILNFLEEYKHTLEFENIVEASLKGYASSLSEKIFEKDSSEVLKNSFENLQAKSSFKEMISESFRNYLSENSEFKEVFEKELQSFIKNQMPLLAREVLQKEIQKILKDEN